MAPSRVCDVRVLRRLRHVSPYGGGCLMEVASVLAGGRWTDRPDCVDPVLAAAARAVNDRTSDSRRARLLALAPWLIMRGELDADAAALALWGFAAHVAGAPSCGTGPGGTLALPELRWWRHGELGSAWGRWRRERRAVRQVRRTVRGLAGGSSGDEALFAFLTGAVDVLRRLSGLPVLDVRCAPDSGWPAALPIRVEVRAAGGADSLHYHCTAVIERWPSVVVQGWLARLQESDGPRPPWSGGVHGGVGTNVPVAGASVGAARGGGARRFPAPENHGQSSTVTARLNALGGGE